MKIRLPTVLLVILFACSVSCAATRPPTLQQIQQQLAQAQAQVKTLTALHATDAAQIADLTAKLIDAQAEVATLQAELAAAQATPAPASTQPTTAPVPAGIGWDNLPTWSSPDYPCTATVYVTRSAAAGGDGSLGRPFNDLGQALSAPRPLGGRIRYQLSGSFSGSACPSHCVIAGPATISGDVGFGFSLGGNNLADVHLQDLTFSGGADRGFQANGGDDVTFDRCTFDSYKMFGACVIGPITGFRAYDCVFSRQYDPNPNTMSCSGLYTEAIKPDVRGCLFYRNGWMPPYSSTAAGDASQMFRHGWYENPSSGAARGGTAIGNAYIRNACDGHQMRAAGGGVELGSVFADNGRGCDVFGKQDAFEVGFCAFFSAIDNSYISWGGGVHLESADDYAHDLVFLGQPNSMQAGEAIAVTWNEDAETIPMPATTRARVHRITGRWRLPGPRLAQGRTADVQQYAVTTGPCRTFLQLRNAADWDGAVKGLVGAEIPKLVRAAAKELAAP